MSLDTLGNLYRLRLGTTGSTLSDLRRGDLDKRPEEFVLVTADHQTAGRGQRGTSWESAPGMNLLFALGLRPETLRADEQFRLSQLTALAVADALGLYLPAECIAVKWPNDIYVGDKKICGILIEHDLCGTRIAATRIGIGVNVNQRTFAGDAPNPVSLRQISGHDIDREALLESIVRFFIRRYRAVCNGETDALHAEYCSRLYRRTGFHAYRDAAGPFRARIAGIGADGRLALEDADGHLRRYAFKEVASVLPSAPARTGDKDGRERI